MKNIVLFFLLVTTASNLAAEQIVSQKIEKIFSGKTKISDPLGLRDPFKKSLQLDVVDPMVNAKIETFSSSKESVDLDKIVLKEINLVGIIYGKERLALIQVPNSKTSIVLKEGMLIGPNRIELRAVFPSGVVFVEKIVNAYDEDEFVEYVIPYNRSINLSTSRSANLKVFSSSRDVKTLPGLENDPWQSALKALPQKENTQSNAAKPGTKSKKEQSY